MTYQEKGNYDFLSAGQIANSLLRNRSLIHLEIFYEMASSRQKDLGTTGGEEQGASVGQELQSFGQQSGEIDAFISHGLDMQRGVTSLQQRGDDNVAIHNQFRKFQPTINFYTGPVVQSGGTFVDKSTKISGCHIGSLEATPDQPSRPKIQIMNTGGGTSNDHNESPESLQQRTITDVFTALLGEIELPKDLKKIVLDALQENMGPKATQTTIEQQSSQAGITQAQLNKPHIPTEEIIEKMEKVQLGENIEKLLIQAFEAIVRQDDSEKSTLMLITSFTEESSAIPPSFYKNHKDAENIFAESWKKYRLRLAVDTYEGHLEDNNETIRVLACICAELSKQLSKREKKSRSNPLKNLFGPSKSKHENFSSRADNLLDLGKGFASANRLIHAIISFYKAAELYQLANNGDNSVRSIDACSYQTLLVVEQMAKVENMRSVVIEHVIPIMREMKDFIPSIENSTHAVRVEYETWVLSHVGVCYCFCERWQQCAKESENAVEFMEAEFQEKSFDYQVFGVCLHNVGGAYGKMGNVKKANELYKMSLKAHENVKNWKSDEHKNERIEIVRRNLRISEEKLKK